MKWGRDVDFPTNPDLADILCDTDFDFENCHVLGFLCYFCGFQISIFSGSYFQESGNPEIWDPKNPKHTSSQNQNPCRTKCRQGVD